MITEAEYRAALQPGRISSVEALRMLKAMGIGLSIDDFGTGYSSLSNLRQFPVDRLKIDKSFVEDIDEDAGNALIVTAVTSLGRSLNLKVVAEGVETAAQMNFVRERGCHEAQGFLLCRPLPAAEIAELLKTGVSAAALTAA